MAVREEGNDKPAAQPYSLDDSIQEADARDEAERRALEIRVLEADWLDDGALQAQYRAEMEQLLVVQRKRAQERSRELRGQVRALASQNPFLQTHLDSLRAHLDSLREELAASEARRQQAEEVAQQAEANVKRMQEHLVAPRPQASQYTLLADHGESAAQPHNQACNDSTEEADARDEAERRAIEIRALEADWNDDGALYAHCRAEMEQLLVVQRKRAQERSRELNRQKRGLIAALQERRMQNVAASCRIKEMRADLKVNANIFAGELEGLEDALDRLLHDAEEKAQDELAVAKQDKSALADRLQELEQELQAAKKAVEEADASAAKMRAEAEERCKKWKKAYREAESRCSELEASKEKLQGELRSISSELEEKVRPTGDPSQGRGARFKLSAQATESGIPRALSDVQAELHQALASNQKLQEELKTAESAAIAMAASAVSVEQVMDNLRMITLNLDRDFDAWNPGDSQSLADTVATSVGVAKEHVKILDCQRGSVIASTVIMAPDWSATSAKLKTSLMDKSGPFKCMGVVGCAGLLGGVVGKPPLPAPQRTQAQDGSTDRLEAMEQELQAAKKAVDEVEASAAKLRADAEERCKKWEQEYRETESRCSELEASKEKLQGDLRSISSELEEKVIEVAGLTEAMASAEKEKLRCGEDAGEWEQKHTALVVRTAEQANELRVEIEGWQSKHAALELLLSQRSEEVSQKQAEINELANALKESRSRLKQQFENQQLNSESDKQEWELEIVGKFEKEREHYQKQFEEQRLKEREEMEWARTKELEKVKEKHEMQLNKLRLTSEKDREEWMAKIDLQVLRDKEQHRKELEDKQAVLEQWRENYERQLEKLRLTSEKERDIDKQVLRDKEQHRKELEDKQTLIEQMRENYEQQLEELRLTSEKKLRLTSEKERDIEKQVLRDKEQHRKELEDKQTLIEQMRQKERDIEKQVLRDKEQHRKELEDKQTLIEQMRENYEQQLEELRLTSERERKEWEMALDLRMLRDREQHQKDLKHKQALLEQLRGKYEQQLEELRLQTDREREEVIQALNRQRDAEMKQNMKKMEVVRANVDEYKAQLEMSAQRAIWLQAQRDGDGAKILGMSEQIKELQRQVQHATDQSASLEGDVDKLEAQTASMQAQLYEAHACLEAAQEQAEKHATEEQALHLQVQQLQAQRDDDKAAQESLLIQLKLLKEKLQQETDKVLELKSQLRLQQDQQQVREKQHQTELATAHKDAKNALAQSASTQAQLYEAARGRHLAEQEGQACLAAAREQAEKHSVKEQKLQAQCESLLTQLRSLQNQEQVREKQHQAELAAAQGDAKDALEAAARSVVAAQEAQTDRLHAQEKLERSVRRLAFLEGQLLEVEARPSNFKQTPSQQSAKRMPADASEARGLASTPQPESKGDKQTRTAARQKQLEHDLLSANATLTNPFTVTNPLAADPKNAEGGRGTDKRKSLEELSNRGLVSNTVARVHANHGNHQKIRSKPASETSGADSDCGSEDGHTGEENVSSRVHRVSWCCDARTRPSEHMRLRVLITHECNETRAITQKCNGETQACSRAFTSVNWSSQSASGRCQPEFISFSISISTYVCIHSLTHDTPHGRRDSTSLPHPCAQVHSRC